MPREQDETPSSNRRRFLKQAAATAGLLTIPGAASAEAAVESESSPSSSEDTPTQEELIKRNKKLKEKMQESAADTYQSMNSEISIQAEALPRIEEGGSHGTQYGYFDASDSGITGKELGRASTKTDLEGVTNEAQALSHNYLAGDAWAWAETGIEYYAEDSGRIQVFTNGIYSGEVIAAMGATASLDYEVIFWNQTDDELVKKDVVWAPSSWIIGGGARTEKTFRKSMEVDVKEGKTYSLTFRVSSSTTAADGDAWADAWREGRNIPGFAKWTSMSYDWVS